MDSTGRSLTQAQETVDRVRQTLLRPSSPTPARVGPDHVTPQPARPAAFDFGSLPEYELLKIQKAAGELAGIDNPFYRMHDERASDTTSINGHRLVNFSSYDYLGLNGHPFIVAAAKDAIDRFGTSVSASRLTAGERPVHRQLERALAALHGTEDAVTFVSGHATNVSVIGGLLSAEDLVVTDALVHNSVVEGIKLSGAKRIFCTHNDLEAFERALRLNRAKYRRALIVIEGLYSMDGDTPDLAGFVRLKQRYDTWLMVDEAHSIGVLGTRGRGVAEEQGVDASAVDIWMGTLSKALTATGGYVAGSFKLVELLKYTSPGLVYSVGLSPPVAAAAASAIEVMGRELWRVERLRQNGLAFLAGTKHRDLNSGPSIGASVVPIIVGSSPVAVILSQRLATRGFNVVPIIFPGVAENQARLRFFITSRHSPEQIEAVLNAVAEELPRVLEAPSLVDAIASGGSAF